MTVLIIDYGAGNLRSAHKAFEKVSNGKVIVSNNPDEVRKADRIVLPGVGAFGDCIANLRAVDGMIDALTEAVIETGKPFMGICVGMQLMAETGIEHGTHKGLGWIAGTVKKDRTHR